MTDVPQRRHRWITTEAVRKHRPLFLCPGSQACHYRIVIPAQAGIQGFSAYTEAGDWMPACAGMT